MKSAEIVIAELREELALAKLTIAEGARNAVAQTRLIHELEQQLREAKRQAQ